MKKIFTNLWNEFFNWKSNPKSVFCLAIPLFIIGIGLCLLEAVLYGITKNDWGYLAVFAFMMPFMAMPVLMFMNYLKGFKK